jgi:outer membrane protein assembly factor BamA
MKEVGIVRIVLLAIGLTLIVPQALLAQAEPARVGKIFIVGNERTPSSYILEKVDFRPGELLRSPDVKTS